MGLHNIFNFVFYNLVRHQRTNQVLVKNDLVSVGFLINVEKSNFNSKTKGKWLGATTGTIEMTFTVLSKKLISEVFSAKLTTARNKQISTQIITCR